MTLKSEKWFQAIVKGIHVRIENDLDYVIVNTGEVGSGKSSFSLLFASAYDPDFTIDNVFFKGEDMIKAAYTRPKGSVLILDEAGYALNPRDSMTRLNRDMAKILTVVRERNHVLIFNAPHLKDIDTAIRNRRVNINIVNSMRIGTLPNGKLYYARGYIDIWERQSIHIPYRQDDVRWKHVLTQSRVPPCDPELYEEYRKKKESTLRKMATEEENTLPRGAVWIEDILKNYLEYNKKGLLNISQTELARLLGVSQSKISKDLKEIV